MTNSGAKKQTARGIRLTLRDLQILEALHTARYLTTPQIEQIFRPGGTDGRRRACQERLRLLSEHGEYIRRIEQPVTRGQATKPYIYALARKGAELLISELSVDPVDIDWQPRSQEEHYPFLEHLLATHDFRILLSHACQHIGVVIQEWADEKELKSTHNVDRVTIVGPRGGGKKVAVVPDAYFKLCRQGKCGIFFVEVDSGSVTIAPSKWERRGFTRKVRAYCAWFASEEYRARYQSRRARVLTVTSGDVRLKNLKAATEGVHDQLRQLGEDASRQDCFWFTALRDNMQPVELLSAPIWHVAGSDTPRALPE